MTQTNWDAYGWQLKKIAQGKGVGLHYLQKGAIYPKGSVKPSYVEFHFTTEGETRMSDVRGITEDLALGMQVRDLRVHQASKHIAIQINLGKMLAQDHTQAVKTWQELASPKPYDFLLGYGYDHKPISGNLTEPQCAHILVAGATGCGKTTLAQSILASMCATSKPKQLGAIILDSTKSSARFANSIGAHVHTHATSTTEAIYALRMLILSLEHRKGQEEDPQEGRIVVYCDELPELCRQGGDDIMAPIETISNTGRGLGVHLLVCAQYPKKGEVSSTIKANSTLRITGRTASAHISTMCTGVPQVGCERLGTSGDFIAMFGTQDKRFQAPMFKAPTQDTQTYDVKQGWKKQQTQEEVEGQDEVKSQDTQYNTTQDTEERIAKTAQLAARIAVIMKTAGKQLSSDEIARRASGHRVEGASYTKRFKAAHHAAKTALDGWKDE